jgi:hypothetical protein
MKNFTKLKSLLLLLIILFLVGVIAVAVYYYYEYQQIKKDPNLIAQKEIMIITEKISRYMDLPTNEEPTIATVTDDEKLKDQDFFVNAQNGDKVLIYVKSAKAILYRPNTNRIINFAPLVLSAANQSGVADNTLMEPTPTSLIPAEVINEMPIEETPTAGIVGESQAEKTTQVSVTLYNGTEIGGLTSQYEDQLSSFENLIVVNKEKAARNDYKQILVIDLNGQNDDLVSQLAQMLGGVVASLPEGETNPQTDILIIVAE